MNDMCGDNRFEVIRKAKEYLLKVTNIETSADEMACLDSFLFRCWQVGWLDRFDETKSEPRKHGHWIKTNNEKFENEAKCSVCGFTDIIRFRFCAGCGAKMDGKEKSDGNSYGID